jgi:hypothetical protein
VSVVCECTCSQTHRIMNRCGCFHTHFTLTYTTHIHTHYILYSHTHATRAHAHYVLQAEMSELRVEQQSNRERLRERKLSADDMDVEVRQLRNELRGAELRADKTVQDALRELNTEQAKMARTMRKLTKQQQQLQEQKEALKNKTADMDTRESALLSRAYLQKLLAQKNNDARRLTTQLSKARTKREEHRDEIMYWQNSFAEKEEEMDELLELHSGVRRRVKQGGSHAFTPEYRLQMMMLMSVPGVNARAGPAVMSAFGALGLDLFSPSKGSFNNARVAMFRVAMVLSYVFALMAEDHTEVADGMSTQGKEKFTGVAWRSQGVEITLGVKKAGQGTAAAGTKDWLDMVGEAREALLDFEAKHPDACLQELWQSVTGPLPEGKTLADIDYLDKVSSVAGDNAETQQLQSKLMIKIVEGHRKRRGLKKMDIGIHVGCCNHKTNILVKDGTEALDKDFSSKSWRGESFNVNDIFNTLCKCFNKNKGGKDFRGLNAELDRELKTPSKLPRLVGNRFFIYCMAALEAVSEWSAMETVAQAYANRAATKPNDLIKSAFNIISDEEVQDTVLALACVWLKWAWWMRYASNKEGDLPDKEKTKGLTVLEFRSAMEQAHAGLAEMQHDGACALNFQKTYFFTDNKLTRPAQRYFENKKQQCGALQANFEGDDGEARKERVAKKVAVWAKGAEAKFVKHFGGYLDGEQAYSVAEILALAKCPRVSDR